MEFLQDESNLNRIYNTVVSYFPNGEMRIKRYEKTVSSKMSGWEEADINLLREDIKEFREYDSEFQRLLKLSDEMKESEEDCISWRNDNLSRTRNTIRDLVWNNWSVFKSFITLTFAENLTDNEEAYKRFRNWTVYIKRIFPEFTYIAVPEPQKRGAIHFHVLSNIPCDSIIIPKREPVHTFNQEKNKWYKLEYYDIKGWSRKKNGYSSAFDLMRETDDKFRIEFYLIKYITKETLPDSYFGKQKFYHSNNIEMPKKQYFNWDNEEYEIFKSVIPSQYKQEKKAVHSRNEYCPNFEETLVISSRKEYQNSECVTSDNKSGNKEVNGLSDLTR